MHAHQHNTVLTIKGTMSLFFYFSCCHDNMSMNLKNTVSSLISCYCLLFRGSSDSSQTQSCSLILKESFTTDETKHWNTNHIKIQKCSAYICLYCQSEAGLWPACPGGQWLSVSVSKLAGSSVSTNLLLLQIKSGHFLGAQCSTCMSL